MLVLWEPGFVQNNVIFQHYIGGKIRFPALNCTFTGHT